MCVQSVLGEFVLKKVFTCVTNEQGICSSGSGEEIARTSGEDVGLNSVVEFEANV